jgi:hypothetical protein
MILAGTSRDLHQKNLFRATDLITMLGQKSRVKLVQFGDWSTRRPLLAIVGLNAPQSVPLSQSLTAEEFDASETGLA